MLESLDTCHYEGGPSLSPPSVDVYIMWCDYEVMLCYLRHFSQCLISYSRRP